MNNCTDPCPPCQPEIPATCEPPISVATLAQVWGHDAEGCLKALTVPANKSLLAYAPTGAKAVTGAIANPLELPLLQPTAAANIPRIAVQEADGVIKHWQPANTADNFICYWTGVRWEVGTLNSLLPSGNGAIVRNSLGALVVVSGTDGQFLRYVGTALQFVSASSNVLSQGYIFGLTLSNGADANNDIDIAVGKCRNSVDSEDLVLTSLITKRSDAAWASGTGNGGMDAGTKPASGTLHTYLISNGATVDAIFSISANGPVLPASYTAFRRIGAVLTDASSNVRGFFQNGNNFELVAAVTNLSKATSTAATNLALTVPTGIIVQAIISAYGAGQDDDWNVHLYRVGTSPMLALAGKGRHNFWTLTASAGAGQFFIFTNTSGQITYSNSQSISVNTRGWIDTRGRDT